MTPKKTKNVLFISYNGLLEPILVSQGIPYLKGLVLNGYAFTLLTYEKKADIDRTGKRGISKIKEELAASGIDWKYLRYHKRPKNLSTIFDIFIGTVYSCYLIISKRVKLVHVRGVTPGAMMLFLPRLLNVKLLFDMRGRLAEEMAAGGLWKTDSLPFKLIKVAEARLLKIADAVTVLTEAHFEYNNGLAIFREKKIPMAVIPCCVDVDRFGYDPGMAGNFREQHGLRGMFILMYQGKLGTFYFINEMLDFFKEMLTLIPQATFIILTPDEPGSVLEKALKEGILGKVRIVRNPAFSEIPEYLNMADAGIFFINPNNKLGSSPIKMGEFLACGVPVVINPGVGDTEVMVRKDGIGVIVEGFDRAAYNDAIKRLLSLIRDPAKVRERCRSIAITSLSLDDGVRKYAEIYKALI